MPPKKDSYISEFSSSQDQILLARRSVEQSNENYIQRTQTSHIRAAANKNSQFGTRFQSSRPKNPAYIIKKLNLRKRHYRAKKEQKTTNISTDDEKSDQEIFDLHTQYRAEPKEILIKRYEHYLPEVGTSFSKFSPSPVSRLEYFSHLYAK